MAPIFSFRKRTFLSPASTDTTSYIHAIVEYSEDGKYRWGTNMVWIADCKRRIELEFVLGSRRNRRLSLAKINLLIKVLTGFRNQLQKEINEIENYQLKQRRERNKKPLPFISPNS